MHTTICSTVEVCCCCASLFTARSCFIVAKFLIKNSGTGSRTPYHTHFYIYVSCICNVIKLQVQFCSLFPKCHLPLLAGILQCSCTGDQTIVLAHMWVLCFVHAVTAPFTSVCASGSSTFIIGECSSIGVWPKRSTLEFQDNGVSWTFQYGWQLCCLWTLCLSTKSTRTKWLLSSNSISIYMLEDEALLSLRIIKAIHGFWIPVSLVSRYWMYNLEDYHCPALPLVHVVTRVVNMLTGCEHKLPSCSHSCSRWAVIRLSQDSFLWFT